MAESVPLSFATFVVKSLGGFLIQEAKNLGGVRLQVEQLQAQLNRMQCLLEAADARPKGGADEIIIRNCVAEIREASYDAEAAIATFVVKIRRSDQFPFVLKSALVLTILILIEYLMLAWVIDVEKEHVIHANEFLTKIHDLGALRTCTNESKGCSSKVRTEARLSLGSSKVAYILLWQERFLWKVTESTKLAPTEVKIVSQKSEQKQGYCSEVRDCPSGVRIVAHTPYFGKEDPSKATESNKLAPTEVKIVSQKSKQKQGCPSEVRVETKLSLRSSSGNKAVPQKSEWEREAIGRLNPDELLKKLHLVQSEKKCLVILDDIWQVADWDSLSPGFPNTTEVGSKILLTTRNENVAKHVDQQCVLYKLRHLIEKESWELFEKKIFLRRNGGTGFTLNTKMIESGKAMVKHCGGVPLAIVVLGGLLATKYALEDWEEVSQNISYNLGKGRGQLGVPITEILALSYQDLPYHLKACFLYLSHLPEDQDIRAKKLIQMWMAKGIVSPSSIPTPVEGEKPMLDVGMSYLGELVQRCMVQVELTSFRKSIKLCRLHDLMRDLCLLKAKDENFLKIVRIKAFGHQLAWADSALPSSSSSLTTIRRLAVYYLGFTLNTKMIESGKAMVKHCGGVPLAIVVLGGLLATKYALEDWEEVSQNISYNLGKGKGQPGVPITKILALSYQDLPYHLKACFLYLSHLPEDQDIHAKKLIQMWMAKGIVSPSSIPTPEMHGSNLCLLKAKDENFLKIVRIKAFGHQLAWADSALPSSSSSITTIRRLAVYYLGDCDANSIESENVILLSGHEMKNHSHIRSCQFYSFGKELESSGWQKLKLLFKGLTLITVLNLERITISGKNEGKLSRTIGSLIYLRYLSIRYSTIKSLPSSIGNLGFLRTLGLRGQGSLRMPNVLWRLKQLRHLYLPAEIKLSCIGKLRLDGLSKLETLENGEVAPKDLVVMLKSPILNNSNRLLQYSSFSIIGDFRTEEEQSLVRQLLGCHHLRQLSLRESLNKLPDQFPPNLTNLILRCTELEEDPMPTLGKLPNLRTLILGFDSYIGKEMVCSSGPSSISGGGGGEGYGGCNGGGFPKLINLSLWGLRNLEEWRVEQGAMHCLFRLLIVACPKLKEIPDGLKFITTLRQLNIIHVSKALQQRVRKGGQDYYKVKHVPSIYNES
ncbi:unnamed protein product [Camellia sinensis]